MKEKSNQQPLNSEIAFENLPKIYPSKSNPKSSHSVNRKMRASIALPLGI